MEKISYKDLDFYKWKVGPSTFLVWPQQGARLMHWYISMADGATRTIIYWPDEPNYKKIRSIRGGNPILFPFVARSYHKGQENFWSPDGKTILPMPRHGFAVDGQFDILDKNPHGFSAKLQLTEENQKYYPYQYAFIVKYHFGDLQLSVDFILKNEDTKPIPWGAGHHFYFQVPWHEGLKRQNYQVKIPSKKAFSRNIDGSLRELENLPIPANLSNDELLDRMHCKLKTPNIELSSLGGEEKVTLYLNSSKEFSPWTTVTTWTENEFSPFYCIEPWMAPANCAEHKKGLSWVKPGESEVFSVSVQL